MGIQDHIVTIGNEAVGFGQRAATLTRGLENQFGNEPTPQVEQRESRGMRPSAVATPNDRLIAIPRDGMIPIQVDLMSKSHGILLASAASSVVQSTPVGATLARLYTMTPTTAGPTVSRTIHNEIPEDDGGVTIVDYLGAMCTELSLSIGPRAFWVAKAMFNYATQDLEAASVTPAYPTAPHVYLDTDAEISFDGTTICQRKYEVTLPTGLNTKLDRVCPDGRRKPITTGRVEPTGTASVDYAGPGFWQKWINGTPLSHKVTITGPEIEAGFNYFVELEFPAVRLTGTPPAREADDLTGQDLPFRAVWDGTNPLWTLRYQTTDTTV